MGAAPSMLQEEEVAEIQRETGFSSNQIARLYTRFTNLDKNDQGFLRRADLLRIPELAINPLGDRIVHTFFLQENGHNSNSNSAGVDSDIITFGQFMRVLARFKPVKKDAEKNKLNDRQEKLRFAFKMYDVDGDGKISREELLNVLHMMVGANVSDEQLHSIADRTILEVDMDQDECISFEEFVKAMERVDVEQKMSIRFLN